MKKILIMCIILAVSRYAFSMIEGVELGHQLGEERVIRDGKSEMGAIIIEGGYFEITQNEDFKILEMYGTKGMDWGRVGNEVAKDAFHKKIYDIVVIELKDRRQEIIYFDITDPYVDKYGSDIFEKNETPRQQ